MAAIYGPVIENENAYYAAAKRNIIANAQKTFRRTHEDAETLLGAIDAGRVYDDYGSLKSYKEDFMGSMARAYDTFGKLTPNQVAAIRKGIAARAARKAEWADKQAALNATLQHLGTVGEKITLTITIKKLVSWDSQFGMQLLHICEDADKNVVIYKGQARAFTVREDGSYRSEGDTFTVTATVAEHGVRNEVKQTVITRPKAA
jgi:hypothetical protein